MQGFVEFNEAAKCNKEENDKDLPFTPDVKKTKPSTAGKYGSAYSTVRNLARQAMQKQAKKNVKEEGGKITVDEETLIEKTTDRQKLRDALDRHTEHAIAANKRGDDEAVKVHQGYINKIKTKMAKLVQNEEVELEESAEHKAAAEVHHNLLQGVMKHGTSAMTHNIKAIMKQHGATDYDKVKDLVRKKGYAGKFDEEVELQEASDSHKVMVTVSDPNHQAVSQRKEQIMKHVIVRAGDKGEAQAKAESFYKKKGYKVHGSEYHSKQPATSMKTEETQLDELDKSTLASYAKKSVAELPKHQMNATYKATGPIAAAHAGKHPKTGESPIEYDNRKVKNRGAGVARAVDKLAKEEVELEEASKGYAPGWMLKADPELAKKVKEKTQGYKDLKKYAGRDIPKKEELDMKTFSQFMEEIQEIEEAKKDEPAAPNADAIAKRKAREAAQRRREEKAEADKDDLTKDYKPANAPKSTTKVIAGKAYGGAAQKDDEDETHPVTQKATEKRGRGRPVGSKSGARQSGAAKKSYGGLTFHSLSLPNSNK